MEEQIGEEKGRRLDFGWFKVPPSQDKIEAPSAGGEPSSVAMGGPATSIDGARESPPALHNNNLEYQEQHRPPSNSCQRPPSTFGERPSTQAGQRPPSSAKRAMSQANHCSEDEAERAFNRINESGSYQPQPPANTYDENIVIDWPLSLVGEEGARRSARGAENMTLQTCDQRPFSRSKRPETPLPPLNLQGYGQERPTYATWREKWHQEQLNSFDINDSNNSNSGTCLFRELDIGTKNQGNCLDMTDIQRVSVMSSPGTGNICTSSKSVANVPSWRNDVLSTHQMKSLAEAEELTTSSLSTEEDADGTQRQSVGQIIIKKLKRLIRWPRSQRNTKTYHKFDKLNI